MLNNQNKKDLIFFLKTIGFWLLLSIAIVYISYKATIKKIDDISIKK